MHHAGHVCRLPKSKHYGPVFFITDLQLGVSERADNLFPLIQCGATELRHRFLWFCFFVALLIGLAVQAPGMLANEI